MRTRLLVSLIFLLLAPGVARADTELVFDGDAPDDGLDHFFLPFDVPVGTKEVEVQHEGLVGENVLDWGLYDTRGFRGWGGGNKEPAIVGEVAASRSYLPGAMTEGSWRVVVGQALIKTRPARYHVKVILRAVPTLAVQAERRPYAPAAPIGAGARWVAGDFHVHSRESGDASPTLDAVATFARGRGLDFVELSEHNTVSQLELIGDAQSRHPELLFVPGIEFTTYDGHANAIGVTKWIDHKIGRPGVTIDAAADDVAAQGGVFSINHPAFELGDACIGCAWKHALPASKIGAIEIGTGSVKKAGVLFGAQTFDVWEALLAQGAHVSAIGGSDDHSAGTAMGLTDSPIGSPTTMVFVDELTVAGIVKGIARGRTVVKLDGPDDPMVDLSSSVAATGDTVRTPSTTLRATITGALGETARFVKNGEPQEEVTIEQSPFVLERTFRAPSSGEDRLRVEALVKGKTRTVTSHLYLRDAPVASTPNPSSDGGCGCRAVGPIDRPWAAGTVLLGVACGVAATRRRRRVGLSARATRD